MARKEYLIDTNIAIGYVGGTLPDEMISLLDGIIDGQFFISVINKIELLGFSDLTEVEELKFLEFIHAATVLDLDDETVNRTIEMRKKYRIKLPDAIIAASSIHHDLTLITRNIKDFKKIEGLEMIGPKE